MIYTVTFNPALDYVTDVGELKQGAINRSRNSRFYYGGKGVNVSVVLTRLGAENTALGFVGGFTGEKLKNMLEDEGQNCDFTTLETGDTRVNVKIRGSEETDINAEGPPVSQTDITNLILKFEKAEKGDFIVLAGSVPPSMPGDIYEKILGEFKDRGICFVVDATGELLLRVLKYHPFLIKPNHHELGELFGVKIENEAEVLTYSRKLREMGAVNVLVSMAEEGALLLDENGTVHRVCAPRGKLVNSVGCGDSMVAGFLAGYTGSGDYSQALKLGCACGTATAFSPELATKDEIEKVFEKIPE